VTIRDRFESGLVDRLAGEFPTRDADWIADEVLEYLDLNPGKVRDKSGYLRGAFRRAETLDTHRRGARPRHQAGSASGHPSGGFTSAGQWDPNGSWDSLASKLVRNLVWWRRRSPSPPSRCAMHALEVGRLLGIDPHEVLPSLNVWLQLASYEQKDNWYAQYARGQNAAETCVRQGGDPRFSERDLNRLHESFAVQAGDTFKPVEAASPW
jgi:hypothetical protein